MAQAKGAKGQILIQEETAFKTDPTPDAQKITFISCGLKQNRGQEASPSISGDRNPTKPLRLNTDVSGPLAVELQAYIGLLFKATMGSVTTTGTGPYTHTFKVGDELPSLLVEKGFTDVGQYFKYNGNKVGSMSFSVTPAGAQPVTFNFVGAKETPSGTSFDATPTDLGKHSFDGFSIATIEEGGVAIANVLGIDNLTINNDPDTDQYSVGGEGERDDIPSGLVSVTGTVKARFENLTLYNKAVNDTESSLKIVYSKGDGLGSAGNESIEFLLSELTYAPNSPAISGPKGVLVELPFVAYYDDSAEASVLQITLKNAQPTI
ncbi:phage tail tube protein [uncultured Desulfuromusa sp.]|uniref:phage tail tube protein n=1 Tax=uncultured Desulfuromusa sp. TaxID=219183 RepID=UPI002AA73B03|nr:phage tail tube protein [uncultured Desulfuromusa sp.]